MPPSVSPLLRVRDLDARYDGRPVHRPLSFDLLPGAALFMRGPNGVGKSTALLGLAAATPVVGGEVRLRGASLPALVEERCASGRLALVLQRQPVFADLTGDEHLRLSARLGGGDPIDVLAHPLFAPLRLPGTLARPAGTCSGGEQRLISLASAWLRRPAVLLLDEPMAGLRADLRPAMQRWLGSLQAEGCSLVVVEHDPDFHLDGADDLQLARVSEA